MATFTKMFLSGSTNGKQIKVTQTATTGDIIHTAVTGTSNKDEVYIYATNTTTVAVLLTIEWGGVASPDDLVTVYIPPMSGYMLVIPGLILQNELVVRAFADTANVINISGYVHRIVE